MRRLVFFEKEQLVSCYQQDVKNRLLARVERGGTVGRIRHCGSDSCNVAVVGGFEGVIMLVELIARSLSEYSCLSGVPGFVMLGAAGRVPTGESGSADH
jgi:hypothetical protein